MASETLLIIQIGRPEEGKRFGQKGHYLPVKELHFFFFKVRCPGRKQDSVTN